MANIGSLGCEDILRCEPPASLACVCNTKVSLEKDEVQGFRYVGWDPLSLCCTLIIAITGLDREKAKPPGLAYRGI